MKMKLKNFDDAFEVGRQFSRCSYVLYSGEKCIFGLFESTIPWGEYIEVKFDEQCGDIRYYTYDRYYIPHFCFEKEIALTAENVMRCGNILEDTEIIGKYSYYRIKIMAYEKEVYYIKMKDGEIITFKKIGKEI